MMTTRSMKARRFCRAFFFEHLKFRPLEGTSLGIASCDSRLEDLSRSGQAAQAAFYRASLTEARRLLKQLPEGDLDRRLDMEKVVSLCAFNLHLLEDYPEHAGNPEAALDLLETAAAQVLRARSSDDWRRLGRRLALAPEFLWQLEEAVRARIEDGPALDRRFTEDIAAQTAEIAAYLRALKGTSRGFAAQAGAAAQAYERFGVFLRVEAVPRLREAFAIGVKEYAWRMKVGLGITEPLPALSAYGRAHLHQLQALMKGVAARIHKGVPVPELMQRLGKPHPKNDTETIRLYKRLSARAKDFVLEHKLFTVPPSYRVDIVPAPPGMGEAITTAAYFPAPAYDRTRKGYFIVAGSHGDPGRLAAHNPFHAASTAVHEAFPGHDLQYAYWQQVARGISPVRHLRADPRNWGDSVNAEGYAHYTEELMRHHGFFSPEEELFNLAAQAWRAARIVVDIGLHAGGMSLKQATAFMEREAFLPPKVAAGEAFRYSKWPTQAVTYGLGKRGIERLKEQWRRREGRRYSEARFHEWFLSFGPLPPDAIARAL